MYLEYGPILAAVSGDVCGASLVLVCSISFRFNLQIVTTLNNMTPTSFVSFIILNWKSRHALVVLVIVTMN